MKFEEAQAWLDRASYLPGSQLQLRMMPEGIRLHASFPCVANAEDPESSQEFRLGCSRSWSEHEFKYLTEFDLTKTLEGLLIKLAIHEVHEWFRVDGVPVTDPHPERKG